MLVETKTRIIMGMYPKNMSREDIAKLSKEEKNRYLFNWLTAKPTAHNVLVVSSILPTLPGEFWDFLIEGIVENLKADKEEISKENVASYVKDCVECWMADLDSFFEYLDLFIEECQPKSLMEVTILS